MMFEFAEEFEEIAKIRVVGVGGAGGNAVNRMIEAGLRGVEFLAANTDVQALRQSRAQAVQIGRQLTRGLGSGGDPRIGRKAIEEDEAAIADALHGSDMVFVTAGMGGGTGTGAAPVVARVARELGALTVAIVTKPFLFEGSVRLRQAEDGIEELREAVDTLIVIPNERLLQVVPPSTSMREAFRIADNILYEATRGVYEIIARPNLVNLDFADVRTVMKGMGVALMGTGRAAGEGRAEAAARAAISSPLLEDVDIHGAKAVLVNLSAADLGIAEVSQAMALIQDAAGAQAHIMFGYGVDESLGGEIQVTVVATGFAAKPAAAAAPAVREFLPPQAAVATPPLAAREAAPAVPREAAAPPLRAAEPEFVAPAAAPAPAPRPAPAAMSVPAAMSAPAPAAAPRPALRAAAAVAGAAQPVLARAFRAEPAPAVEPLTPFLTPVSPDEVELGEPAPAVAPAPRGRAFLSDALLADLNEPAYTRKYLD